MGVRRAQPNNYFCIFKCTDTFCQCQVFDEIFLEKDFAEKGLMDYINIRCHFSFQRNKTIQNLSLQRNFLV